MARPAVTVCFTACDWPTVPIGKPAICHWAALLVVSHAAVCIRAPVLVISGVPIAVATAISVRTTIAGRVGVGIQLRVAPPVLISPIRAASDTDLIAYQRDALLKGPTLCSS